MNELVEERKRTITGSPYNNGKCDVLEHVITDLASIMGSPIKKKDIVDKSVLVN